MNPPSPGPPRSAARRRARLLREQFMRQKFRFAAGVLLLLATNSLALAIPWMLKYAVDAVTSAAARAGEPSHVGAFAAAIAVLALAQAIARSLSRVAILGASRHVVYELRNRFFARMVALPAPFFDAYRTGDLMSRAVNDLLLIRSFFGPGILNLANTVLSWTGAIGFMAAIDLRLTLWSLIPYPFVLIAMNRLSRALYLGSTRTQEQLAVLSSRAQENLAGISQVKAYDLAQQEISDFNALGADLRKRNLYLARVRGAVVPLMGSVGGIGTLLVLWLGTRHVITGSLTIGAFVAFNAYLASLAWPTIAMGWILNVFQRSLGALDRISEVLDATVPGLPPCYTEQDEAEEAAAAQKAQDAASNPARRMDRTGTRPAAERARAGADGTAEPRAGAPRPGGAYGTDEPRAGAPRPGAEIEIRNLRFSYAGAARPALQDVSFHLGAGRVLGIVGPVGSGKTSLVRLIARLYPVPEGAVHISGVEINNLSEGTLRRKVAMVPQESFLFSISLAENIALGRPGASRAEIEEAGRMAGLVADLEDLPHGYDTPVGERGYTLSGGQRQRVSLARALLMEPEVLLLDDPFASIDAATEETILAELSGLAMTRIIAGHRVSAVQAADEILVLDGGLIAERGTHPALLASGGLYARLFERQQAEREIETA